MPWSDLHKAQVSFTGALMCMNLYILAYKPTLKLPQNEEFCKHSHINRKHNVLNQTWLCHILFEVQLNWISKLSCSLSELTLFNAASIFMAVCMTEW